jgi:hypothetical protein
MDPKVLFDRVAGWLRKNPDTVVTALRNARHLRLTVPLDALRFLASSARGKKAPKDVEITAVPPGLRLGATLYAMKTNIRASATLIIQRVQIRPEEFLFELSVRDIGLKVLGASDSPVAALIQSGALDLSKPGKLVSFLPNRPPFIVEADGDRIVIDLMRDARIAERVRKITGLLTPLLTVSRVETAGDHLGIQLACLPDGIGGVLESLTS